MLYVSMDKYETHTFHAESLANGNAFVGLLGLSFCFEEILEKRIKKRECCATCGYQSQGPPARPVLVEGIFLHR